MWHSALSLCEGDLAKRSTTRVAYLKWRISTLTMSFRPPVFRRHWLPSQASTMPPRASARPPPPRCSLICFPEPTKATDIPRCDFISGHWNERSRRMEQLNGPMRPANRALVWSHSDLNSLFPGVFTTPFSAIMPCTISMIFNLGADNASIALTKGYVDFIRAGHNAMSIHLQCGGLSRFFIIPRTKGSFQAPFSAAEKPSSGPLLCGWRAVLLNTAIIAGLGSPCERRQGWHTEPCCDQHCAHARTQLHDDLMTWKRFLHCWPFVKGTHRRIPLTKGQ